MTIEPLDRRVRLSEQALDAIRRMIVRGAMQPGARISEPELAERLGISRTPVREAMLQLAQEGLVTIFPQSGSFVAPIQLDQVEEAQFIREHLECAVIREAAARVDAAGLANLRTLIAQQEAAQRAGDPDRFYALDEELHAAFSSLASRPGVWRLIQRSKLHLDRVRHLSLPVANQIPRLIRQHHAVVDAIGARDADAAEQALRGHLREVFATIRELRLDRAEPSEPAPPRERRKRAARAGGAA